MQREGAVIAVVGQKMRMRREQFEPDQRRRRAADEKESGDHQSVEERDALVVGGEQPFAESPALRIEIAASGARALGKRRDRRGKRRSSERSGAQGQRADIGGQFEDLRVVDLALERRHDRVVAGRRVGLRIENPIAQIDVVDKRELAVGERNLSAVKAAQVGRVNGAARLMASRAAEAREQRSALRDEIAGGALAREPGRKVGFAHDDDRADHSGMSGPAELSAEEMEDARLGRPEAGLDIPARQDVLLDAKGGHRERVDDVLRSHVEPHRLVHRHVKRVDLARAVRVLDLPHPLLGDNVDLHRVARRQEAATLRSTPPTKTASGRRTGWRSSIRSRIRAG